jgi:uncharacterized protein
MQSIDVRQLGSGDTEFSWIVTAPELGLGNEKEFQYPISIEIKALKIVDQVMVSGMARCRVGLACRRCNESFNKDLEAEVAVEYREGIPPHRKEDVIEDGDRDASWYTAPLIDLTDDLRQILLVAVPEYPLCGENCRGLCPVCGADINAVTCSCRPLTGGRPFAALERLIKSEKKERKE